MVRLLVITGLLATTAAPALAAAPLTPAERDARIEALETQVRAMAAELATLRQTPGQPAPSPSSALSPAGKSTATAAVPTTTTPTSPATAGNPALVATAKPFGSGPALAMIDAGRPVIASADGRYTAGLLAVMQYDVADYFQSAAGPLTTDLRRGGSAADSARARNLSNGSTFRRARFGIAGKVFGDFEYTALFAFDGAWSEDNGHVQELWLQYSGLKPFHVRVGAFRPSLGLEDQGSTNGMPFLERPASTDVATSLAGGDFREGGQIVANNDRLYASAAITGRLVSTAGAATIQPYDSQRSFIGRVAAVVYRDADTLVHVGAHGSYVDHPANTGGPDAPAGTPQSVIQLRERPELRVDGTRLVDTGAIAATHAFGAGVEAAVQYRNLLLQGEYERLGIDRGPSPLRDPRFSGFYVEGTWLLTGERRRYNGGNFAFDGPTIASSFNPRAGNYGAVELGGRYSQLDLDNAAGAAGSATPVDGIRGGRQRIAAAVVNWYLNPVMRIMFQYQYVDISRLSPNPVTFLTPVGAYIGQTFSTGAARFQFAF